MVARAYAAALLFVGTLALLSVEGHAQPTPSQRAGELMTETRLDRSVAGLVAEGWQVVAVSQSGPVFAYHLVHEGSLAICYFNLAEQPPNSLCYRMAAVR